MILERHSFAEYTFIVIAQITMLGTFIFFVILGLFPIGATFIYRHDPENFGAFLIKQPFFKYIIICNKD